MCDNLQSKIYNLKWYETPRNALAMYAMLSYTCVCPNLDPTGDDGPGLRLLHCTARPLTTTGGVIFPTAASVRVRRSEREKAVFAAILVILGILLGALVVSALLAPRLRLLRDELIITRRDRERLQGELVERRADVLEANGRVLRSEHELLALRRRVLALTAERDAARAARISAEAAYRDLLAERDRLQGELALNRRREIP